MTQNTSQPKTPQKQGEQRNFEAFCSEILHTHLSIQSVFPSQATMREGLLPSPSHCTIAFIFTRVIEILAVDTMCPKTWTFES